MSVIVCKTSLYSNAYLRQGPDFVWHIDGYDKLKPYGFAIHGCIDGLVIIIALICILYVHIFYRYSRKVIWLKLMTTNNDPNVILLPYLLAVIQSNGEAWYATFNFY